jgi:large subunit ribosomal protein L12
MEYIYGALLLHKLGQQVTEESLKKVIAAAGVQVDESKIKALIASLQGVDISAELQNASAISVSAGAAPAAGAAKAEEKKEEEKPVESAAGLSALFG